MVREGGRIGKSGPAGARAARSSKWYEFDSFQEASGLPDLRYGTSLIFLIGFQRGLRVGVRIRESGPGDARATRLREEAPRPPDHRNDTTMIGF